MPSAALSAIRVAHSSEVASSEKNRNGPGTIVRMVRSVPHESCTTSGYCYLPKSCYKAKVENLAHTLLGATLAKAGLEKKTAFALPTLVVAANLPDIDSFVGRGQSYFDHHRGITHSLLGVAVLSVALAGTVWVFSRIRAPASGKQVLFLPLWLICAIGVLSHPFLDFLGDYGLRPFLPFSSKWYYGDMLGIVDPWLWVIFGFALFVATGTKAGKAAWIALAAALDALIFFAAGRTFATAWTLLAFALVWAGTVIRRHGLSPARIALAIFITYLGATAAAHYSIVRTAWQSGPSLVSDSVKEVSVLPGRPGTAARWTVVMQGPDKYYIADVGLQNWVEHPPKFEAFPKNLQNIFYREALAQPQMAALARFARFPSVQVSVSGGLCTVWLRDLRYARYNISGWGVATTTVPQFGSR